MKSVASRVLRRFGYLLANGKKFEVVPRSESSPPSRLNLLALAIAALVGKGLIPTIVQVGASDGVTNDPLYGSILRFNLPALLIEPDDFSFQLLRSAYAGCDPVRLENCAVGPEKGVMRLFRYKGLDGGLLLPRRQLSSRNRSHLIAHGIAAEEIEVVDVPCAPLASLLGKHGLKKVHVVQVDVEGADDEIVRLALGLRPRPCAIHFEHLHLAHERRVSLLKDLHWAGYEFAHTGMDTLAFNSDAVPTDGVAAKFGLA